MQSWWLWDVLECQTEGERDLWSDRGGLSEAWKWSCQGDSERTERITWRHWQMQRMSGKIVLNLVWFSGQSWRSKMTKWNQHWHIRKMGKWVVQMILGLTYFSIEMHFTKFLRRCQATGKYTQVSWDRFW